MTMPLVQLGPGGDYVRKIVPTDDRLQSISRPFTHPGRPVGDGGTPRGVLALLIAALRMLGILNPEPGTEADPDVTTGSESTSERPEPPKRPAFIDRKAARRLRSRRSGVRPEMHSRHDDVLERCLGIDRGRRADLRGFGRPRRDQSRGPPSPRGSSPGPEITPARNAGGGVAPLRPGVFGPGPDRPSLARRSWRTRSNGGPRHARTTSRPHRRPSEPPLEFRTPAILHRSLDLDPGKPS